MANLLNPINLYSYTGRYLSLRLALWLFFSEFVIGICGFMFLEDYSLLQAFYMVVITISTVGYGEVKTLSPGGELFASILILLNIGIFAYAVSAFSFYVIQGEIFKRMHLNFLNKKIDGLKNHVILCGYGKHGKDIAGQFLLHGTDFVVIERNEEEIESIQKSDRPILYIDGDATRDEILQQAGIDRAKALIAALGDDTENLFTVLSARQLNQKINIISRAFHEKSQRKILLAGADHVIMPEQIGGFYIASLVNKPGAIEFFTFLTDHHKEDIEFDELDYEDLPSDCQNKSIRELEIRKMTGTNIIGFKKPDGNFVVNPSPDIRIEKNSSFIVLGTVDQLKKLRAYFQQRKKA